MYKPESELQFGPIHDRIGPIVDPAFLRILDEEQIKNIVVTVLKAEHTAMVTRVQALEKVLKIAEGAKVQSARK